jgi:hypothetical protein
MYEIQLSAPHVVFRRVPSHLLIITKPYLHQGHQPRAEQLGRRKVALAIDDGEVAVERAVRLHRGGDHLGQRRAERP